MFNIFIILLYLKFYYLNQNNCLKQNIHCYHLIKGKKYILLSALKLFKIKIIRECIKVINAPKNGYYLISKFHRIFNLQIMTYLIDMY